MDARTESHVANLIVVLPRHTISRDLVDNLDVVRDGLGCSVLRTVQSERGAAATAHEESIG